MLHYGGAHLVIKLLHLRLRVTGLFLSTYIIIRVMSHIKKSFEFVATTLSNNRIHIFIIYPTKSIKKIKKLGIITVGDEE